MRDADELDQQDKVIAEPRPLLIDLRLDVQQITSMPR